jgi:hypothetical protein
MINLMAVGCPIGRNELTDDEWIYKGIVLDEETLIRKEERKES